ncbi:hypothetical protein F5876DRAFT_77364 [Lentinula aff. lateritia]|uniref:Uncharacterized protein n=1 Tax=Lentinula aff. lateritia TaxID=2804960 RepID=A0ACC1TZ49_9AGAR|nr:hypothetical protein F5876DRAFT_77364 [Lentinula aff. lateritia]
MDLTDPIHRDCAPSTSYQTPVSAPLRQIQHSPAYMQVPNRNQSSTGPGPGHLITFPSSPILSPRHHSSIIPSLPSFPSLQTLPQSVSETWHPRVPTFQNNLHNQNHFNIPRPLPPAPTNSLNNLMETYTPNIFPPFPFFNYLRSPVLVPPASATPVQIASRIGSPLVVERAPSRIMHQPQPHQLVDLDRLSAPSMNFHHDLHSAPAVMTDFHHKPYGIPQSQPNTTHTIPPWFPAQLPPLAEQAYPVYYPNQPYPYPYPYNFPSVPPRSNTPRFKIEYLSIHSTFLATIKDTDSLKDRKSWVKWNEGVWQAVADGFVLGHILLSDNPTRKEIKAKLKWDKNDGWTSSILTARLSDEARNHLPPMIDDRGERRTARQIYICLKAAYQAAPDRKACL